MDKTNIMAILFMIIIVYMAVNGGFDKNPESITEPTYHLKLMDNTETNEFKIIED